MSAERQRRWRAAHGARTGQLGRPVIRPCGTLAAYRRHKRHGEPVCDACRLAYNEAQRGYHAARKVSRTP